ncbi:MAG: STAS domain-containing protein [Algiphilus sp.]|uniref:STAS domain-containing protein n=1 Tax=Algiphilus sp. TaxID=1872431 RepID=UPI001CA625A8|nr:STAS domain-containing protein [Algiphilus sp.]MBY8966957.1 STAS domain-containing protein [Algiphilus acroporae]MCI5062369.1 STAS domain-containing protein [Algiphilus sp.]MCI5103077.1 STAS domain-containing protein [Algiphilus sp.]
MPVESDVTSASITLPADLHMGGIDSLRQTLVAHVEEQGPLTLDGGAVDRVSTAGLQLLVVFFRDRMLVERSTQWTRISDPLRDAVHWLGLADHLALSSHSPLPQS